MHGAYGGGADCCGVACGPNGAVACGTPGGSADGAACGRGPGSTILSYVGPGGDYAQETTYRYVGAGAGEFGLGEGIMDGAEPWADIFSEGGIGIIDPACVLHFLHDGIGQLPAGSQLVIG